MRRPPPTLVLALVSVVAVVVGATVALGAGRDATRDASDDVGRPPQAVAPGPAADPDPGPAGTVPPGEDGAVAGEAPAPAPPVGVRSGRLEDLPAPASPPTRIRIGALAIDVPVVEVGVDPDAAVAVPDDVGAAGWYRYGPAPGEPGSAVVTAHVDSATQGAGAFFPLREATPGTAVEVTFADGTTQAFEVVGRRSYPKATLPTAELFARSGPPVLTLITCGGAFDAATRSYEENVVVFAEPASP